MANFSNEYPHPVFFYQVDVALLARSALTTTVARFFSQVFQY